MDICNYSPQISPGNSNRTPIASSQPTLTPRDTVLLEYPFDTPTESLELRNPSFNNKIVPKINRILRFSRGRELIVYRDPVWLKQTILNWSFVGLSAAEASAALDFCLTSIGRQIKLTDFESRVYKGVLLNPSNPISQEGKLCMFTFKLDFQGELQ